MAVVFQAIGPAAVFFTHALRNAFDDGLLGGNAFKAVVGVAGAALGQLSRHGNLAGQPGGVHNAQVFALQRDGQLVEHFQHAGDLCLGHAGKGGVFGQVGFDTAVKEPA